MTHNTDLNDALFERAKRVIPGGVNSPVRAFRAVGGTPRFVKRALGAYFWDANDRRYIDYIGSWGPMILGHGHPAVVEAVQKAVLEGFSFGAPTEREIELAEEILKEVPSMEMVRLVSSGTEAGMSAIRLARGATGRSKIIKFEGCYHGHADALLVKAGSGLATFGNPTSAGVPAEVVQHTLVLEYNNVQQLEEAFALHGQDVACLMIEPIAGNMNFVRASVPFMQRCRELCSQHGALLVFDEVMTGFRVALGSAQSVYAKAIPGFKPDITVLGKVIGGGMPLAAFGGPRALMEPGAAAELRPGHEDRRCQVQYPVPRPAGPRRLHRPGAVRGRLRQRRAQRGRHCADGGSGARSVQIAIKTIAADALTTRAKGQFLSKPPILPADWPRTLPMAAQSRHSPCPGVPPPCPRPNR